MHSASCQCSVGCAARPPPPPHLLGPMVKTKWHRSACLHRRSPPLAVDFRRSACRQPSQRRTDHPGEAFA
jgi:hypothetical protein